MTVLESPVAIWPGIPQDVLDRIAARAGSCDADDTFVAENYRDLKEARAMSALVPTDLGGGGATYAEIADTLRQLAHVCGSTALAYSMHSHLVAALVWRRQNQGAPVDGLLRRIADEQLVLVSSGGNDWLNGSGSAKKVEGGYLVSGRKMFASGSPVGDLLMTMAIEDGETVLHLPVNLRGEGVSSVLTWQTLGMRGTGSNDLVLEDVFVPEAAVGVRRPVGKWHPSMHLVAMIALPLIYSVYTGLAEAAVELAVESAKRRPSDDAAIRVGEMRNELMAAQLAHREMIRIASSAQPGDATTDQILTLRVLVGRAVLATVDRAMEAAGGSAFFRKNRLERIFRDAQASRYHPEQPLPQARYSGWYAMGGGG